MRSSAALSASLLVILFFLGCGGTQTPKEQLDQGNKAFFTERNYEEALELYQGILDWKREGAPSSVQRFEAHLNLIRCKIRLKDFEGALKGLHEMQKEHEKTIAFKNYTTVIGDLLEQKATSHAIDVLGIAGDVYPDRKEQLKDYVEKIKKIGVSDKELERLKTLGYL